MSSQTNVVSKQHKRDTILVEIICSCLILLFMYTGIAKYLEHDKFYFQLRLSPLPFLKEAALPVSWLLPGAEIMIALALLTTNTRTCGLFCAFVLMFFFTGYVAGILLIAKDIPCTCGGVIQKMSWAQHLAFNFFS